MYLTFTAICCRLASLRASTRIPTFLPTGFMQASQGAKDRTENLSWHNCRSLHFVYIGSRSELRLSNLFSFLLSRLAYKMQIVQGASPLWQEQTGTQPISYAGAGEMKQKAVVATAIKVKLLPTSKNIHPRKEDALTRTCTDTSTGQESNNKQNWGLCRMQNNKFFFQWKNIIVQSPCSSSYQSPW